MKHFLSLLFLTVFITAIGHNSTKQVSTLNNYLEEEIQFNIKYTYKIVRSNNNTWCYDIFINNKLFIHQTSIPGLPGNQGFNTKSDAKKVARLVIDKLKKGEIPPSVSLDEMNKLKINTNN